MRGLTIVDERCRRVLARYSMMSFVADVPRCCCGMVRDASKSNTLEFLTRLLGRQLSFKFMRYLHLEYPQFGLISIFYNCPVQGASSFYNCMNAMREPAVIDNGPEKKNFVIQSRYITAVQAEIYMKEISAHNNAHAPHDRRESMSKTSSGATKD